MRRGSRVGRVGSFTWPSGDVHTTTLVAEPVDVRVLNTICCGEYHGTFTPDVISWPAW
jgi:hypothetical protein